MVVPRGLYVCFMNDDNIRTMAKKMNFANEEKQKEYLDSIFGLKVGETYVDDFEHSFIRI